MDRVEFRVVEEKRPARDAPVRTVVPYLNGRSLIDLAHRVEAPAAARAGNPDLAGSYTGLGLADIAWPSGHFSGAPVLSWFGDGDTVLLGCTCGEWGCWPLTARVTVDEESVVWAGFRHGHRDWDYDRLGPFRFARGQYQAALAAVA